MTKKPRVLILKADGINCDEELAFAFDLAGGDAETIHVNELRNNKNLLKKYQILGIPGGFSYGDDVTSGKILAVELTSFFAEALHEFARRKDTLTLGICNGFQVLVRTGLLPFGHVGQMDVTLAHNASGRFECRWVNTRFEEKNSCEFLSTMKGMSVSYQVAHGEGRFFATPEILKKIEDKKLVVLRYVNDVGKPTQEYPANPNGALHAIAGICDSSGRILGMMPHPERFVRREQHPNWRRMNSETPQGLPLFENMVHYAKEL